MHLLVLTGCVALFISALKMPVILLISEINGILAIGAVTWSIMAIRRGTYMDEGGPRSWRESPMLFLFGVVQMLVASTFLFVISIGSIVRFLRAM